MIRTENRAPDSRTDEPTGIIYLIRNARNGKVYIGQTIRKVGERWKAHIVRKLGPKCGSHVSLIWR